MKKSVLVISLFLFLLFTLSFVSAEFQLSIEEQNTSILPLQSATYLMKFKNLDNLSDVINIFADANNWILSPQTVVLPPNGVVEKQLIITPRSGVRLSNYRIPLTFQSTVTNQVESVSVLLSLSLDLYHKGYPLNIAMRSSAPEKVDPRDPFNVRVYLKNNNLRDIKRLDITISSDLFEKEFSTPLRPLAPFSKEFTFNLDPLTPPGTHDLSIVVRDSETSTIVGEDYLVFTVEGYGKILSDRKIIDRSLFRTVEEITFTHYGNEKRTQEFDYHLGNFESWFTSSEPEGVLKKDPAGGKLISWVITLSPGETKKVLIIRNYRLLAVAIIILIALIIAYFVFRSPIVAYKEAHITAADKEGVSQMRVRIYIRNRSNKTVTNVKIIDRVPNIMEYLEHNHLGSLQPSKVTRTEKKGTILRWELESLEPYEERIITYKVKSKLKIVGKMNLPEAKIKFDSFRGKERITTTGIGEISKRKN